MDEGRQVQSPVDTNLPPLALSFSPVGKLIFLSEGDSVYKRRERETTLGRGRFDYYVRSSETERKGKTDRPFDAKWILEKVFMRPWWLRLLTCRAPRFSNSFAPSGYTIRRLPFDSDALLRGYPSGSLYISGSNKAESAFPPFRIQRLTCKRDFARCTVTVASIESLLSVLCFLLTKLLTR